MVDSGYLGMIDIDFCGSYVQYCRQAKVYVISRAVENEVVIIDKSFRRNRVNEAWNEMYIIIRNTPLSSNL